MLRCGFSEPVIRDLVKNALGGQGPLCGQSSRSIAVQQRLCDHFLMASWKALSRTPRCAAFAVIVGFLLCTSPAFAIASGSCASRPSIQEVDPQVPSVIGKQLFDEIIAWIAINTSYDVAQAYNDPPTISFCEIGDVIDYEQSDLLVDAALLAAFDRGRRHIFLTHPWSPVNLFDQSVLLHELIHDVQLQNRTWECVGAPESEAYLLQDKWLVEHGVRHPFDWQMIRLLSQCQ